MGLPRRLPHIEGARGRALTGLYWLIALPTIVAVLFGLWFAARDMGHNVPSTAQFGFRTFTYGTTGHSIGAVGPEAARAGLRVGDRIVAIDGAPLAAGASEFAVGDRLSATAGANVRLALLGQDGKARDVRLERRSRWGGTDPASGVPVWLYVIIELLSKESFPVVMIAASLMLMRRRPNDPEARLFAFALLMLCLRAGSLWWWPGSPIPRAALQGWWVCGWIAALIAITGFPDGRFATRTGRWVAAALLVQLVVNAGAQAMAAVWGANRTVQTVGGLATLAILATAAGAGIAVIQRYRGTAPGAERQQIKWVVFGSCITVTALIALILIEMSGVNILTLRNPLLYLGVSLCAFASVTALPLGLIVSLLRFRLYDAEATISRSAVYAALTVSLLSIFAATEKLVETLGQQYFGGSLGTIAGGIGAALAAVMIAPLHRRLSDWSERRFQQGLVTLRTGLPLLMGDMRETASIDELARAALKRAEGSVRARHAALLIDGQIEGARHIDSGAVAAWLEGWTPREAEGLDCDRADRLFPMRVPLEADGCGRVGWLLLGPRPDGSFYGKDEREALASIADPVARAVAIVLRREASRTQFETRIGRLEAAIERLTARKGAPA